jgi:hypothetical protein
LRQQPSSGLVWSADSERAELVRLRCPVVGDELEAREDLAAAAGQLWGRGRAASGVLDGIVPRAEKGEGGDWEDNDPGRDQDGQPPLRPDPPPSGGAPPRERLAIERAYRAALRVRPPT